MKLPPWLKKKIPNIKEISQVEKLIKSSQLHTVCKEAKCPNYLECFAKKTATFLALGNTCTRHCLFCNIASNKNPPPIDPKEITLIANSIKKLDIKHAVITMVTRDDLNDGGAFHIAKIIKEIKKQNPKTTTEVLTSDFNGNQESIKTVLAEKPTIFNHNIETVKSLSSKIRNKASYSRSLEVLSFAKSLNSSQLIKSGLMLGLGESVEEIKQTIYDLSHIGCDIITIGQYLQPSSKNIEVKRYIPLEEFKEYENYAKKLNIKKAYSGPFVRSSYNAKDFI